MDNLDLKSRVINSTAWFATTRLWMQALSWGVTLILARLLTPGDYGLYAMALAFITLLDLLREFGLGSAIIQRQDLDRRQINAIFWIVAGTSVVLVGLSFLGAPLASRYYGEPRLVWLVRILGVMFLLNSFGTVPYSLLTKEIDFRKRSLAEASGVVASVGTSLSLAYLGYGVWALVIGNLVKIAVQNVFLSVFCRWLPGVEVSFVDIRNILTFGMRVAGSNAIGKLSAVANPMIIGRFLGGPDLGLYTMADSLGTNPFHKLSTQVINQLSFPVFSKLQREDDQLRLYFLKITKYLAVISLPMQVGMALVSRELVSVFLSDKWLPTVGLVQAFSISGIFYVLALPASPLLTARGRTDITFRLSVFGAILTTVAILIGARFGLLGVAIAWVIAFPLTRMLLLAYCLREVGLSLKKYFGTISTAVLATGLMAVTVILVRSCIPEPWGSLRLLFFGVSSGVVAYVLSLLSIDRKFGSEVLSIVQEMFAGARA